jgi:hypothetical protein
LNQIRKLEKPFLSFKIFLDPNPQHGPRLLPFFSSAQLSFSALNLANPSSFSFPYLFHVRGPLQPPLIGPFLSQHLGHESPAPDALCAAS